MKRLLVLTLFMATGVSAQVSVFTNPDSDAIVFETYTATTVVVPKTPAYEVTVPSTFGDSTFYVSPGGYVTRTYEVEEVDPWSQ